MAEVCSSPAFASVIDGSLLKTLRQTADLTRKFNENLDCLAVRGINSMVVFVFQNNADDCNLTEALVDWQEDVSIKNLVNWRDNQNTHSFNRVVERTIIEAEHTTHQHFQPDDQSYQTNQD
ncbi:uncharacterized protein PGTG_12565 [Puccinia graminis f. sp. tritici CRL 75-36-700-3]|uniref:Uncharacterized protein n=1 Tax=Puccinia graminis f. sp. tritici (strain CRL 75-36-700-3 / race SCCL) TaxID=418459 RepID=E3KV18_PUCGT|nr:uncharacterized protein PGTG_12565 [Puccinia graminis f. sp. tritici CRL 75-36-700-3]EFP88118.2 hypothetical protein PGTG_12565 [Puccinia graminis f. sp. tritici CRL 75-36-700-3]